MATKRDQLQAYQFLVQRVVSALVTRETDPEQPPFRRPGIAGFGSIALALLVLAGFWVYGKIVPGGNDAWRDGEAVIMEKETGTRFVYVDGRLHPVPNYVSGLLVLGQHVPVRGFSRRSLDGAPRGPVVGIADAPDALVDRNRLLDGPWSMCSQPVRDKTGASVDESVLMVGQDPGGQDIGDAALLVRVFETGDHYLLWRGQRHRIRSADTVAVGLALRSEPWATVGVEVMDALPAGEPLEPIRLADLGRPSTAVPAMPRLRVGQLLVLSVSGGEQHYLVERQRLRPLSALQYDVQRAFRPTALVYGGREPVGLRLGPIAAGQARLAPAVTRRLPVRRPAFAGPRNAGSGLCAVFASGGGVPRLVVDVPMPARDEMLLTTGRTGRGLSLADRVVVPPGRAAVVESMTAPGAPAGALGLVTDLGIHHPLSGPDVLGLLGYAGVQPIRMPVALVARIPAATTLDPTPATRQLTPGP